MNRDILILYPEPAVTSISRAMKALADPSRLRIVLLLEREELTVAELQEILGMGQSRISTQLSVLKQAELVEDRKSGKNSFYRLRASAQWVDLLNLARKSAEEVPEAGEDSRALLLILERRRDRTRAYFDELAGRFGREYVPGRSWKGLAEALLMLMPPLAIADLGCGEGAVTQLLARRAKRVIGIDSSNKMIAYAAETAKRNGLANIEFRLGDLEAPPIRAATMDVALFSQSLHHAEHPNAAIAAAHRILKPGGRVLILDLKRHSLEEARDLYSDRWLGFSEAELDRLLRSAGFEDLSVGVVHREEDPPYFETVLASGVKPA
jgi:SAM-dependent methyltransferase